MENFCFEHSLLEKEPAAWEGKKKKASNTSSASLRINLYPYKFILKKLGRKAAWIMPRPVVQFFYSLKKGRTQH